jgi:Uma2 family endonuclease
MEKHTSATSWQDICENPALQDLPFKIETNKWGQIVMSPASNWHGNKQIRIGSLLLALQDKGDVVIECSVQTSDGVKVADVAWCSQSFMRKHKYTTPYPVAPDVCVEVISPSNQDEEIAAKIELYLAKGAKEVWTCDAKGKMRFFNAAGEMKKSGCFPKFPPRIK